MDTSNSAKISISDMDDMKMKSKTARCIQHSLSQAMAEALYQPHTMVEPKPLASRVKNAGKDFLRHNQTCQWIQFMQEPQEPTNRKDTRAVKVAPSREIKSGPVKEVESSAPPITELPPPVQQSSPSYEEQLLSLHKQQEELLEQQRHLEDQMEQQKQSRQMLPTIDIQPKPIVSEAPEVIDPLAVSPVKQRRTDENGANNFPPSRFRRRLKGSMAQSFAERDEGSIGSLLYNTKGQETPADKKSDISSAGYGRYARPNLEGRNYSTCQESGSSISQVLSHMPGSTSCESVRHVSECSPNITDGLLAELTIDDRKGGHGDF